jgi:hypothetical protein
MYVCMFICMYMCLYVYIYICLFMYTYVSVHVSLRICLCPCLWMYIMYMFMYGCLHICMAVMHVCVCMYACVLTAVLIHYDAVWNKQSCICSLSLAQLRLHAEAVVNYVGRRNVSTGEVIRLNISRPADKTITLHYTFSSVLHFIDHNPSETRKTKA